MIPDGGVPHVSDIPRNTTLVALAPYASDNCANMLIDQAFNDGAQLIIFANDTLVANSHSTHLAMLGNSPVSVLAVSAQTGQNAFMHMSLYNSNTTVNVPNMDIKNTLQRVGIQVQSQLSSSLPRLWVFVLAVIAGVLAVIVLISLILNFVLYMRRRSLRRRILDGQVNLELLGVKRMTVPQEVLDKIPVRIYTHGEQHFHNDESGGDSSPKLGTNSASANAAAVGGKGNWKDRLKPHNARAKTDAVATAAGASGVGPSRQDIGSGYSQTSCPICLEDFEDKVTPVRELACDHIYHTECIDNFLKTRSSLCPLCKKSTLPTGYIPASLRLTNATVRREREMRRRTVNDVESGVSGGETNVTSVASAHGGQRSSVETAAPTVTASGDPVGSATPMQQPNLEALAVTEEEEAAEQRRRPGWRRVLHKIFPF